MLKKAKPAPVTILDRIFERGAAALTERELVVLILGEDKLSPSLAKEILDDLGGLDSLLTLDLRAAHFLSDNQAAALVAAIELGRRLAKHALPDLLLDDPAALARHLFLHFGTLTQEVFGAVFVNAEHKHIDTWEFSRGGALDLKVEPRPILRAALRLHAYGLILFHYSPRESAEPRREDIVVAERMISACRELKLVLIDSLVLAAGGSWSSIRQLKPWW